MPSSSRSGRCPASSSPATTLTAATGRPPTSRPPAGDDAPTLRLRKDDLLVGSLQTGKLKVDTAFDTVTVDAAELRSLTRGKDNPADLSVTTWDGTVFNGQVQEADRRLPPELRRGRARAVRPDRQLHQPRPRPCRRLMQDQIKKLVADLDADDWQARDAAEKQLVKLGPAVTGALRAARDKAPPEAQQRIDAVLRQVNKK